MQKPSNLAGKFEDLTSYSVDTSPQPLKSARTRRPMAATVPNLSRIPSYLAFAPGRMTYITISSFVLSPILVLIR